MNLSEKIVVAFANVKPDKTQSLHQAQYTGDFGMSSDFSQADYNAAAKKDVYLRVKHNAWQQISYQDMLACDCALTFATRGGAGNNFVFFMAASLFYAAKSVEAENLDDEIIDRIFFQLTYEPDEATGLNKDFALFSVEQQQLILQFFVNCQQLAISKMENGGLYEPLFNVAEIPIITHQKP